MSQVLAERFELVPICPEVKTGLGVPREPIQLSNENNQNRIKNISDWSLDFTDQLKALADQKAADFKSTFWLCIYAEVTQLWNFRCQNIQTYQPI